METFPTDNNLGRYLHPNWMECARPISSTIAKQTRGRTYSPLPYLLCLPRSTHSKSHSLLTPANLRAKTFSQAIPPFANVRNDTNRPLQVTRVLAGSPFPCISSNIFPARHAVQAHTILHIQHPSVFRSSHHVRSLFQFFFRKSKISYIQVPCFSSKAGFNLLRQDQQRQQPKGTRADLLFPANSLVFPRHAHR